MSAERSTSTGGAPRAWPCVWPCAACGAPTNEGMCCSACRPRYMNEQHRRWELPGTASRDFPVPPKPTPETRPSAGWRTDPVAGDDEQVGLWPVCLRALEDHAQ